jgi:hypothetical protein
MNRSPIQGFFWPLVEPVKQLLAVTLVVTALFLAFGCQHIGPKTIVDDRLAYNKAVLTSWEQQTLLNIVRVRYHDLVSFVDVGTVTQQHSLMGTAQAMFGAMLTPWNTVMNSFSPSVMGSRTATDQPTITYTPLTSAEFVRNLNAPLRPFAIFNLIESGYHPRLLLNMTLSSINEIPSAPREANLSATTSPEFRNLTEAIECAYGNRDLSFPVQPAADGGGDKVFMIIADKDSPEARCDQDRGADYSHYPVAFIRATLRLKAAETKFEIVPGSRPRNDNEIAVRTRSVISAMIWLSNYVDLPGYPSKETLSDRDRPLKVEWSVKKPHRVFTAVPYAGYWFWIKQGHENSKSSLIYLRILLALADTGPKPPAPVLTIPVSR